MLLKLALWGLVEMAFNVTLKDGCQLVPVGPECGSPVPEGSVMLTGAHGAILLSLLAAPPWLVDKPYSA